MQSAFHPLSPCSFHPAADAGTRLLLLITQRGARLCRAPSHSDYCRVGAVSKRQLRPSGSIDAGVRNGIRVSLVEASWKPGEHQPIGDVSRHECSRLVGRRLCTRSVSGGPAAAAADLVVAARGARMTSVLDAPRHRAWLQSTFQIQSRIRTGGAVSFASSCHQLSHRSGSLPDVIRNLRQMRGSFAPRHQVGNYSHPLMPIRTLRGYRDGACAGYGLRVHADGAQPRGTAFGSSLQPARLPPASSFSASPASCAHSPAARKKRAPPPPPSLGKSHRRGRGACPSVLASLCLCVPDPPMGGGLCWAVGLARYEGGGASGEAA